WGEHEDGERPKDTLDREFIELGIDALRRLSTAEDSLQNWAITRHEVDEEQKIGVSSFSDVYKGIWRGRSVAIKVLAEVTPRTLFIHEVNVWKSLSHPNVLELLGAFCASSEPPLFFISPYMKNGSLVSYLKGLLSLDSVKPLKMIHEIAMGTAYLHSKGVLHGDLKGANVLLDDQWCCVISDYGQSEIKSEVYRLSGTPAPHGALRWQAPELVAGEVNITQQTDVYAFAMYCIEVLTKGGLPWPLSDEDTVRRLVLKEGIRPEIPIVNQQWIPRRAETMQTCWVTEADRRPSFAEIVEDIQRIRQKFGDGTENFSSRDLSNDALPEQIDDELYDSRDERRYRQLLQHEFHPSLSLPLWTPTPVPLGSIGYLAKPQGKFVTLFNAFKPLESSGGCMSSVDPIESLKSVTRGMQKSDERSVVQRGTDMIQFRKAAYLFAESTAYRYMDDLWELKRWLKANIDAILKEYGVEHNIGREDVILVIGTLEARDYALYASHGHLDGELDFNVYSSPRAGRPWGYFSVPNALSSRVEGYAFDDPEGSQWDAEKVSTVKQGGKWDAVLFARLRFTTDSVEPTSK
ncbi:kinase-like protein, partial [Daedalea quercina L-15889]